MRYFGTTYADGAPHLTLSSPSLCASLPQPGCQLKERTLGSPVAQRAWRKNLLGVGLTHMKISCTVKNGGMKRYAPEAKAKVIGKCHTAESATTRTSAGSPHHRPLKQVTTPDSCLTSEARSLRAVVAPGLECASLLVSKWKAVFRG